MVMQNKEVKTDGAAGACAEGGRRPTAVPAPAAAAPELLDRPRRRTFTVQTKLRVLAETDAAADVGGIALRLWQVEQLACSRDVLGAPERVNDFETAQCGI